MKKQYIASVWINTDCGDFQFVDLYGLNDTSYLIDDPENARDVMRKHLKKLVDTFTSDNHKSLLQRYRRIYDNNDLWKLRKDGSLYICEDMGNWGCMYAISPLPPYAKEYPPKKDK